MLHCFNHDNRVIDHEANREHESKERQGVDAETEDREEHEGADERNRHRAADGISVARQPWRKTKDDDDHQDQRLNQRVLDRLHPLGHGERGVEPTTYSRSAGNFSASRAISLARFLRGRDRI